MRERVGCRPRSFAGSAGSALDGLRAIAILAVALQFGFGAEVYFYGPLYGLDGFVMALVVAGLVTVRPSTRGFAWLSSRPMVFLAAISYTFYLAHGFVVNASRGFAICNGSVRSATLPL